MPQQNRDWNNLGKQVNAVRESRENYSLYRLAKDAKLDYSYLYRLMHGNKYTPSKEKLLDICRALRCSLQEASEIFNAAGYVAPAPEDLEEEESAA